MHCTGFFNPCFQNGLFRGFDGLFCNLNLLYFIYCPFTLFLHLIISQKKLQWLHSYSLKTLYLLMFFLLFLQSPKNKTVCRLYHYRMCSIAETFFLLDGLPFFDN